MTHQELQTFLHTLTEHVCAPLQPAYWEWQMPPALLPEAERKGLYDRFFLGVLPAEPAPEQICCPFCTVIYVQKGTLTAELEDASLQLAEGQTLLLAAGTIHRITGSAENGTGISMVLTHVLLEEELKTLFVELSALRGVLLQGQPSCLLIESQNSQPVRWYMEELCCEHYAPDRYTWAAEQYLLQMLLLCLDRDSHIPPAGHRHGDAGTVNEILRYLHTDYADATLQSTAARFGFSPNYLSHLLKEHTGKGFQEHRNEVRMLQAAAMLKQTDLPVSRIAQEVGIQNTTHFYRIFQNYYGMTPGEFRSTQ